MTPPPTNARRVWGGATHRTHDGRTGARRDLYRELHPEMFADIPSSKPVKPTPPPKPKAAKAPPKPKQQKSATPRLTSQMIVEYLRTHGDCTARQISEGLGVTRRRVSEHLSRMDDIEPKEMHVPEKGNPIQKWGVIDA